MQSNRRTHPRNDLNLIVEIKSPTGVENYHLGMTKNISAEAFTLESQNYNIKPGQVLEIDIKLPDINQSISAIGKVLWVKVTEFECLTGILFLRLDEEAKNRMAQLCLSDTPEPGIDMHEDYVPDSNSSKIGPAVSETVNTSSNLNVPGNKSVIPEVSDINHKDRSVAVDENMEKPAAKSRSAAQVNARKELRHLPVAVISFITVVAIVSIFVVTKWKSKTHVTASVHTAFNEIEPIVINPEPAQLTTPNVKNIEQEEIAGDISGEEQLIIIASEELDNEIKEEMFSEERVLINDIGKQSPEPERDEAGIVSYEAPSENSESVFPIKPAVEKDTSIAQDNEMEQNKIASIIENNRPDKEIIPLTASKKAFLKKIRQKIIQKYKQTQKPSAMTKRDIEKAPTQINDYQAYLPVNIPETPAPVAGSTVIAKAGQSEKMSISGNDIISGAEPSPLKSGIASPTPDAKKSASEPVSITPASPLKETIRVIPESHKPLPAVDEKQFPVPESITTSVSLKKFKDNKTRDNSSLSGIEKMIKFDEAYEHNADNWNTFNTRAASAKIHKGAYIIENKREKGAHLILHHHEFPADSDFLIETSIRLLKKSVTASFGLVFGAKDAFNNYSFQISTKGLYMVSNYHRGISMHMTIGEKEAANINISALNKLKIIRSGNAMSFFINDKLVDIITDLQLYGKKVGFIIDGRSTIAVEHMHSEIQVFH